MNMHTTLRFGSHHACCRVCRQARWPSLALVGAQQAGTCGTCSTDSACSGPAAGRAAAGAALHLLLAAHRQVRGLLTGRRAGGQAGVHSPSALACMPAGYPDSAQHRHLPAPQHAARGEPGGVHAALQPKHGVPGRQGGLLHHPRRPPQVQRCDARGRPRSRAGVPCVAAAGLVVQGSGAQLPCAVAPLLLPKSTCALGPLAAAGAHLRVEKDAAEWFIILGGAQAVWDLYIEKMRETEFDFTTPLYIATVGGNRAPVVAAWREGGQVGSKAGWHACLLRPLLLLPTQPAVTRHRGGGAKGTCRPRGQPPHSPSQPISLSTHRACCRMAPSWSLRGGCPC